MNREGEARLPLPCGAGAGGEGRSTAAPPNQRAEKRGHGYAPAFGQDRQRDHARTKRRAARQRKEMMPSEKLLWKLLRSIEGHTFRRQVAIGDFAFDFGNSPSLLLIEVDGSIHERADVQTNDRAKEVFAVTQGFRVLRFANNDVWDRPAWVIDQVRARLSAPHPPTPLRKGEGG